MNRTDKEIAEAITRRDSLRVKVILTSDDANALATFLDHSSPDLPPGIGRALNSALSNYATEMGYRLREVEHAEQAKAAQEARAAADAPLPAGSRRRCQAHVFSGARADIGGHQCGNRATVTRAMARKGDPNPIDICGTCQRRDEITRAVSRPYFGVASEMPIRR